ncbi:MAG: LytTR family DNA-binding domain-containing protein, partial [Bacteroidota bacterium]
MPHGNGFDLLEQWKSIPFEIIFVTAYSQYAIEAFNQSASSYLLKPISIEALEKAVLQVQENLQLKADFSRAQVLLDNISILNHREKKLVLPLMEGFDIVKVAEILYCEAEDNFTRFYFTNGSKTLICRSMKFYEKALSPLGFYRIHRSHMINLEYLRKYIKGKGGSVILEGGKELMVSNAKKSGLIEALSA